MRKYILLLLWVFFLFGCAAKKLTKSESKTQTSTDSSVVEQKHQINTIQNAITTIDSSEEFEITPIDTSKPIIIGNVKYFNAKVRATKNRKRTVDSSKSTTQQSEVRQVSVKKRVKAKDSEKKIDRKANYSNLLWLLLIVVLLYLGYRYIVKG
ncbi:MAG: hypothetical protein ACK5DE_04090 [Bacteroidota bacterium]|jgi:hypothetical protein